ncbi:MAG TPA: hypothetical protein PK020_00135 [Ilumatobacteraceae bacterium]|nr:hypothetical protein [Ilumatobacteraceae bacterium]HRB01755.1 hypothetical protein [Ilumatobacteraceae bacterium]
MAADETASAGVGGLSACRLLARFEPVVRFNQGEYFLPASVEAFASASELWERTGPGRATQVAVAGELDLDRLVELTHGAVARHYLRLVTAPATWRQSLRWKHRQDRPRFRAETRLGRVGVVTRLVDAAARASLLARGRTPRGAEAAAAVLDRDRSDHGDHPYYGRVTYSAGYTVLQYWYFFFFNDWRSRAYGVNDHEGDWEQVTIYLTGDSEPTPKWVAFSAHDEVGADLRRRWDDPDITFVGEHPVVHAGLGSHAGAALAGEYLISVRSERLHRVRRIIGAVSRFLQPWTSGPDDRSSVGVPYVEYARGDGVAIGPGTQTPCRQVVIDDETPWVRDYTGLWGDDTNDVFGGERGPAGPRYERDGSVRTSWSDPVGWAALDAVSPDPEHLREAVTTRLHDIENELAQIEAERDDKRRRLRAGSITDESSFFELQADLLALGARATVGADERRRLHAALDVTPPPRHPHAHLRHRVVPVPAEARDRRYLLRIWATISTPLLLGFLAILVRSEGPSLAGSAVAGLVVVLGIEALTRGRFQSYVIRVLVGVVIVAGGWLLVLGFLASWRTLMVWILVAAAGAFLVANLRELRRS